MGLGSQRVKKKASPEVIRNDLGRLLSTETDDNASLEEVQENIRFIMKILGERFGKKYGNGKKSDMDFVKMDVSKVRRFQEELMVDVRNMKLIMEGMSETIKALQTKNNTTTPDYPFSENNHEHNNSSTNDKNNDNDNNANHNKKTDGSLTKPNMPTVPYSINDNKKIQQVQKKRKKSGESPSDSESDSRTSSQNSSDNNKRKKDQNRSKSKNKSGHKGGKEKDSDSRKHDLDTPIIQSAHLPTMNPMQDFGQNNVYPSTSRFPTSASSNHIPLMSQMYPGSPAGIPYSNRRILNPFLGQNMGYTPQVYERDDGFHNYRFQPENQEIANQLRTNVQYYAIVPRQTLHVPNTTIPRSMSDTALHRSTQLNQDPQTHQLEVPYMTSHVLPHMSDFQTAENPTYENVCKILWFE